MLNEQVLINTFARQLRKLRKKKGMSQEDLADRAGLHRTYISDVERGNRNISLRNIHKIAVALEVEVYNLLQEEAE